MTLSYHLGNEEYNFSHNNIRFTPYNQLAVECI